eukprot:29475-Pelagococcus_subviridis.AAC.5
MTPPDAPRAGATDPVKRRSALTSAFEELALHSERDVEEVRARSPAQPRSRSFQMPPRHHPECDRVRARPSRVPSPNLTRAPPSPPPSPPGPPRGGIQRARRERRLPGVAVRAGGRAARALVQRGAPARILRRLLLSRRPGAARALRGAAARQLLVPLDAQRLPADARVRVPRGLRAGGRERRQRRERRGRRGGLRRRRGAREGRRDRGVRPRILAERDDRAAAVRQRQRGEPERRHDASRRVAEREESVVVAERVARGVGGAAEGRRGAPGGGRRDGVRRGERGAETAGELQLAASAGGGEAVASGRRSGGRGGGDGGVDRGGAISGPSRALMVERRAIASRGAREGGGRRVATFPRLV